jgi:hypothetical protein
MHRRTLFKASAATIASALNAPAIAQGDARVLRCAPEANLASIDPIWTTATVAINHGYMVYDTLFGVDLSLTPRPQMAAGHTVSDDGRTWTITLRDGLFFHDGEKVRSADCIASIDRWSKRSSWGQALGAVNQEMTGLLPHPGMLPSGSSIASPECSRHHVGLSIDYEGLAAQIVPPLRGETNRLSCLIGEPAFPSRPDCAPATAHSRGDGRSGATRSHAQRALAREHGEHRTFPDASDRGTLLMVEDRASPPHREALRRSHTNRNWGGSRYLPECLSSGSLPKHHLMRQLRPPRFHPTL